MNELQRFTYISFINQTSTIYIKLGLKKQYMDKWMVLNDLLKRCISLCIPVIQWLIKKFYLIGRVVNGLTQNSENFLFSDKSVHQSRFVEVLLNDAKKLQESLSARISLWTNVISLSIFLWKGWAGYIYVKISWFRMIFVVW